MSIGGQGSLCENMVVYAPSMVESFDPLKLSSFGGLNFFQVHVLMDANGS